MKKPTLLFLLGFLSIIILSTAFKNKNQEGYKKMISTNAWKVDFLDNFDNFNSANWQDQRIWVNNETNCYVPDNEFGTREVSNGSLKLKVVRIDEKRPCDNFDKYGKQHPETQYVSGRIASKNRKEFVKGKWTGFLNHAIFLTKGEKNLPEYDVFVMGDFFISEAASIVCSISATCSTTSTFSSKD